MSQESTFILELKGREALSDKDRKHRENKLKGVRESKTKSATNDKEKNSKTESTDIVNGTDAAKKKSSEKVMEGTDNSALEEDRGWLHYVYQRLFCVTAIRQVK
ncbi:hypothetical protein PoB_005456800 [Plakobranchus ocellatus]|uniref:Uncharacterized protein n=1 Tax=Plakobranchus ocellatus TaxID=259542 RepID=A0AAV4CAP7_9GAST|nr:hypothetical protein PoB_005456800 [Plakobranchus ocellatus]